MMYDPYNNSRYPPAPASSLSTALLLPLPLPLPLPLLMTLPILSDRLNPGEERTAPISTPMLQLQHMDSISLSCLG
jgi:hypothetical protein